jgi:CRISPR/Cas system CSM-associated protein Csm3 (group 7 of RAMP superfamily)
MKAVRISLRVTCASPPSVGAGGTGGTLADKVVVRDGYGRFILPGSQVKGKLRHACEQLLRAYEVPLCRAPSPEAMCPNADDVEPPCLLCRVFGSPGDRSRLHFHDLPAVALDAPPETLRAMVSLNRARRTAQEGRLFLVETAPHVQGLEFAGEDAVTGFVSEAAHVHLLLAGFQLLFAWGGGSTRGLGWGEVAAQAWLDDRELALNAEEVKRLCRS